MPQGNHQYNTQSAEDATIFYFNANIFKYNHFLSTITDTNLLHHPLYLNRSKKQLNKWMQLKFCSC